jgi:hypothetical protein
MKLHSSRYKRWPYVTITIYIITLCARKYSWKLSNKSPCLYLKNLDNTNTWCLNCVFIKVLEREATCHTALSWNEPSTLTFWEIVRWRSQYFHCRYIPYTFPWYGLHGSDITFVSFEPRQPATTKVSMRASNGITTSVPPSCLTRH